MHLHVCKLCVSLLYTKKEGTNSRLKKGGYELYKRGARVHLNGGGASFLKGGPFKSWVRELRKTSGSTKWKKKTKTKKSSRKSKRQVRPN